MGERPGARDRRACSTAHPRVDTRLIEAFAVSASGIRCLAELAARNEAIFAGACWAVIAEQEVIFGMARTYATMKSSAPFDIEVFRTPEKANA